MWEKKKLTGQRMHALTKPGSLLIVVDTQMDDVTPEKSMTPPDVFYFSDRRGFYVSMAWLDIALIESLRSKGASYLVVSGQSVVEFKSKHRDLLDYLSNKYPKLMDDHDGVAFTLNPAPRNTG